MCSLISYVILYGQHSSLKTFELVLWKDVFFLKFISEKERANLRDSDPV